MKAVLHRLVLLSIAVLLAPSAWAVAPLKLPLSGVFARVETVVVGKVVSIDETRRLVEAQIVDVLKGAAVEKSLRIQIVQPEGLLKLIKKDLPVVAFIDKNNAASVSIADTWNVALPIPNQPMAWRTVRENEGLRLSFPGSTQSLVRLLPDLKMGKSPMLESADDPFAGETKSLGKLTVNKPVFMLGVDFNGDKKTELLVGTADGVRLFAAAANGFEDVTEAWGLKGVKAEGGFVTDVNGDGRPDVVLDGKEYRNDRTRFTAQSTASPSRKHWQPDRTALAWAMGDFDEDGKPAALVVRADGIFRHSLDGKGEAADFARLTGEKFGKYTQGQDLGSAAALAMDVNGDGRMDLVLAHDKGAMVLINRGFGAFFVSLAGGRPISPVADPKPPFAVSNRMVWAGADLSGSGQQDLLVLAEDGTLYAVTNPKRQ